MSSVLAQQRSSAAALAAASGGVYAPHSPPDDEDNNHRVEECQPLDFSSSRAPKATDSSEEEYCIDVKPQVAKRQQQQTHQQPKKRKLASSKFAETCFSTPSPSPPERNVSGMRNNAPTNMHGNANMLTPTQQQQQAAHMNNDQLNAELMQTALMSLMQSSNTFNQSAASLMPSELWQTLLLKQTQQQQQQLYSPRSKSPNSTTPGNNFLAHSQAQQQRSPSSNPMLNSALAQLAGPGPQLSPSTAAAAAVAALGGLSISPFPLDPAVVALTTSKKSLLNSIPAVSSPMLAATTPSKFANTANTVSVSSSNGGTPSSALLSTISPTGSSGSTSNAANIPSDALAHQSILISNTDPAYQEFRNKVLASKQGSAGAARKQRKTSTPAHASMYGESDDNDNSNCGSNSSFSEMDASHLSNNSNALSQETLMMTNNNNNNVSQSFQQQQLADLNASRKRARPMPGFMKDDAYWERRRKNNEAAKRSRDLRRAKEDEIAIRCAFLEQENLRLKYELMQTRIELDKTRALWLNSQGMAAQALNGNAKNQMKAEMD